MAQRPLEHWRGNKWEAANEGGAQKWRSQPVPLPASTTSTPLYCMRSLSSKMGATPSLQNQRVEGRGVRGEILYYIVTAVVKSTLFHSQQFRLLSALILSQNYGPQDLNLGNTAF